MKKYNVILLVMSLIVFAIGFYFANTKSVYKPVDGGDAFSNKFIKTVNKDSFIMLLKRVYNNNLRYEDGKEKFECTIFNQGQFLNNFFNTNTKLLKETDYGFAIKVFGNNDSLQATFEKKIIDSVNYINLPTDVIFGVANQVDKK